MRRQQQPPRSEQTRQTYKLYRLVLIAPRYQNSKTKFIVRKLLVFRIQYCSSKIASDLVRCHPHHRDKILAQTLGSLCIILGFLQRHHEILVNEMEHIILCPRHSLLSGQPYSFCHPTTACSMIVISSPIASTLL